jgi:hypothetical protein
VASYIHRLHADYGTALKEHLRKRDPQGDPEIERIVAKLEELRKKVKLNLEDMPQIERTVLQLAKKPKEKLLWARVLQRLAGWALGVIEVCSCLQAITLLLAVMLI